MNFLGMGPMELLLIVVLALIVFGPAKLPEIMAQVGKAIGDFRRATSDLSDEFNRTIQAELQETRAVVEETKAAVSDARSTVNSAITGVPAPVRSALPPSEVVPAPTTNGITAEPHAEGATNGSVTALETPPPPLADTAKWSWETSPSPAPATPAAEAAPDSPASTDEAGPSPIDATPPATPPGQKPVARDELLPPY
jgi:TatA/E family protein of Tat protein translocase